MKIGKRLKRIMDQRGLSSAQVARLAQIPQQRLSDWLADVSVRDFAKLKAVCDVLGVSLDEMLFDETPAGSPFPKVNTWISGIYEIKMRRLR